MVTVQMLSEISLEGVHYYSCVRQQYPYGNCIGIWHIYSLVVFIQNFFDRGLRYQFESDLFWYFGTGGLFDHGQCNQIMGDLLLDGCIGNLCTHF